MNHSDKSSHNKTEDRLDVFASVQNDPEVWELVQKKYHQFEELHQELEGHESHRRDLLSQLSDLNEKISGIQKQLLKLSGKEVDLSQSDSVEDKSELAESTKQEDSPKKEDEFEEEGDAVVGLSPLTDEEDEPAVDLTTKPSLAHEAVLSWPGVDNGSAAHEADSEVLADVPEAPVEVEAISLPDVPAPIAEPVVAPVHSASVLSFAQPTIEQSDEPAITPEPAQEEVAVAPVIPTQPAPLEVQELQHLFDAANDERRKSDSALKLVQLYDGKAEVFFVAMCRSHQQNGLAEDEARKEAIKDVQTMIATAKAHADKVVAPTTEDETDKKSGGVRRLFSH